MPANSQQSSQSEQELAETKGLLCTAEEQKSELAEHLKNANAIVEQYRAMVLTLEDNLKKEKEVQFCFVFFRNSATCPRETKRNLSGGKNVFLFLSHLFQVVSLTCSYHVYVSSHITLTTPVHTCMN